MIAQWTGNGQVIPGVVTLTVSAVATNGVLSATLNGKVVSYTCLSTDTTATAASAWQALLAASTAPPEFQQITWTVSSNVVTATGPADGRPFVGMTGGLTSSGTGNATLAQATTTAASSANDVGNANNWIRNNVAALPQNGDDVVIANSSVDLLYNLNALTAVQFLSLTRWQSFTATIGLPVNNPNGYLEYLPTYFAFSGNGLGALPIVLGQGITGTGPGRERYNVGNQQAKLTILASGAALDTYAVAFLGTHKANTVTLLNTSLGIAMYPAEVASLSTATVDGGGTLALGAGVTFGPSTGLGANSSSSSNVPGSSTGSIVLNNAACVLYCAPQSINAQNGSQLVVQAVGLTFGTVQAQGGSAVTWLSDSAIANLILQTSSVFDKSQDVRPIVISTSTQDGDTTLTLDPFGIITWSAPITFLNAVASGPVQFAPGRKVQY